MGVAIGVDSHKSSLAAAALDELGRVVGVREFANDERGHDALLGWAKAEAEVRIIGIEGAGSFGAGLARHLLDVGEVVYEVPAFLSYRERKRNPPRCWVRKIRSSVTRLGNTHGSDRQSGYDDL